ncbi:MAG TPA: glycosyltransferase family 1 protein [Candidatus Sulfopaludibacter sp.]|jgi:glycosyltransferase involved in cell wall biosynthesis|nr:glycosyltransferase family 1 protein [Candidatus Sulfopaludibacter sp.]
MRFAVDAHAIGRHLTGNEVYVRSLLNAFAALDSDCEFVAYISADSARASVPASIRTRSVPSNPFLRLGFDLARKVSEDRPDLLHVQYTAPVRCHVPVVVSVHDVSFLEHPEYFTRDRAWQLQWTVRRTVKSAAKILTGSEFSRNAILKVYGDLDEDKVVVVPNAAASEFRPIPREAAAAAVRDRYGIAAPFILSVGDIQPRKNQIGLIKAFARLLRAHPQLKQNLVLVGKETWFADRVREAARESGVGDRIQFFGFVSDSDLLQFYNACDLFVFPSFYEGFGLPALEAMACGRAVVCSNTSALPEVVDGAAILFDPYAIDEIVRAIADLLLDSELRARMERLGLQRAAHFSWQKTAQRTLEVFHEVVAHPAASRMQVGSASIAHR